MPEVSDYNGNAGISICPNTKVLNLLLSLRHHVDVLFPRSQNSPTSIEVLPDECLIEIFTRLPGGQDKSNSACVSKRWLALLNLIRVKNGKRNLSRYLEGKKATDTRLAAIAVAVGAHGGLEKLSIRGSGFTRGVTNLGLKAISRACSSLRELSLRNLSSVGDEGLIEIAKCHLLETLVLSQCSKITDNSLIAISENCPSLSDLTISSCSSIGNESLIAIGKNCLELKFISINNCPLIGDQGFRGLFSSASHVLRNMKLQSLNISDASLATIGLHGTEITNLSFTNLHSVTRTGFWAIGKGGGLLNLEYFSVFNCQGITDVSFEAIGKGCPALKSVYLSKCADLSDTGLVSFAKSALSLWHLNLKKCHKITQVGLYNSLRSFANLKDLGINNCSGIKDTNSEFSQTRPRKRLSTLSIKKCSEFGDNSLDIFTKLCPRIEDLTLTGLVKITDDGLLPLLQRIDFGLKKVKLSNCVNITDKAVSHLAVWHGRRLKVININGCKNITDNSMLAIAKNCYDLKELNISNCGITDYGIEMLSSSSNEVYLNNLSISGCSLVLIKAYLK